LLLREGTGKKRETREYENLDKGGARKRQTA